MDRATHEIDLTALPHRDARRLLASTIVPGADAAGAAPPVWVFVNPVEFHGPHLSLRTDELISMGLARDLHRRVCPDQPFVVGGRLEMGVDPTPGPGSRAFSFEAVRDAVTDVCNTLVDLGASRVILMTFHGSPMHEHALEAGCVAVRRRGGRALNPMNALLDVLVTVEAERFRPAVVHIDDEAERERVLENIPLDFHAGFLETSLMLHYAPSSVSPEHKALPPCPPLPVDPVLARMERAARRLGRTRLADELKLASRSQGWGTLRPFPGYTGSPHLASERTGAYFAGEVLKLYEPFVRGMLDGAREAPGPIMPWVLWATLGGRMDAAKKLGLEDVA